MRITHFAELRLTIKEWLPSLVWITLFLLPLKLSWTLAALLPLLALYLICFGFSEIGRYFGGQEAHRSAFLLLILWLSLVGIFGLSPSNSLRECSSLLVYSLFIVVVYHVCREQELYFCLLPLLLGQSLASIHTIANAAFPLLVPEFPVGRVTESGQLALVIPLCVGVLCSMNAHLTRATPSQNKNLLLFGEPLTSSRLRWLFMAFLLSSGALAFSNYLTDSTITKLFLLTAFIVSLSTSVLVVLQNLKTDSSKIKAKTFMMAVIILPLCTVALLANLKRGPWIGVVTGCSILMVLYSRKLIVPIALSVLLTAFAVEPIRMRLEQSAEHFFIHGGRKAIWDIGAELAQRYPLGIGYQNSGVLREFSTEIPPELRHFHNNFLNILVETGWIGLAILLWWLVSVLRKAWRPTSSPESLILSRAVAASLISWQVAGSVEYNFGDTEIMLIVFAIIGLLEHIQSSSQLHQGLRDPRSLGENSFKTNSSAALEIAAG